MNIWLNYHICKMEGVSWMKYILYNSNGDRLILYSPNKKYALYANNNGNLYICSNIGEIKIIYHNDKSYVGIPNIGISNHGELIMNLNNTTIYKTNKRIEGKNYTLFLNNRGELIIRNALYTYVIN